MSGQELRVMPKQPLTGLDRASLSGTITEAGEAIICIIIAQFSHKMKLGTGHEFRKGRAKGRLTRRGLHLASPDFHSGLLASKALF